MAYISECMLLLTCRKVCHGLHIAKKVTADMARTTLRTVSDIGKLIRAKRRALGLDQAELAERARVSRLWVNEVEAGKPGAGIARIMRTLAVLDLRLVAEDREPESTTDKSRHAASAAAITRIVSGAGRRPE